jgi:short-subunit dehydrogenase
MNIVITGASNGIGFETALQLSLDEGNHLIAIARSADKLKQLKEQALLANPKSNLIPFVFDIEKGNYSELKTKINELGTIDILINNAGLMIKKPFFDLEDVDWMKLFQVNLFGPVKLIKTIAPLMGKKRKAHIVNISSMGGFQGSMKFPGLSAYAASKAALANLTEVLAAEFEEKNIAVNCLAIGAVETDMLFKTFPEYKAPLKAIEMAEYIADFSLNGHKYYNGKILPVALSTP